MNRQAAIKIINETVEDQGSSRQPKQQLLQGLTILAKHDDDIVASFEHDQIWASSFDQTVARMTTGEVKEMARLNWFYSEESWSHF